ncbi:hypothetical protein GZ172_05540 [Dermatophilus congolensis]|uniref:hypothetical protein n=1 Tax=Dermatophilus congolensis TaxID=1863 RepID=UPI001AAFC54F|nr:hypothetical protein [Dermatophilus congolensis]MBO3201535.1 hypothetical protein [Dermatophilus congolensis]MBO3217375.1 hypothetical protein [Dermatophilus congolensis]
MSRMDTPRPGSHGDDKDGIDAAFAGIIANWDQVADQNPPTPESSAHQDNSAQDEEPGTGVRRPTTPQEVFGSRADLPRGWRTYTPAEEGEEEFIPPNPENPFHFHNPTLWGAVLGMVGGPLMLIVLVVFAPGAPRYLFWLAVVGTFVGFGLMVSRLPARRDPEEEDRNDGAVV